MLFLTMSVCLWNNSLTMKALWDVSESLTATASSIPLKLKVMLITIEVRLIVTELLRLSGGLYGWMITVW